MSKKSPNVVFACKYLLSLNSIDNKFQSLGYKEDRTKDVDEMIDYFSNVKKNVVGMFEYYMGHTRGENVNLVLENGQYANKKDIKKIKEDYKKYIESSNLWKGIISFKSDYLNYNISIKDLEQKMAKEIMPQFLKYCGFKDVKKMSYVFSVHTNKKHPHIHLAFIEKQPNYLYCDKKVNYRRQGKITKDEQRYLKRLIELCIEREKVFTPLLKRTNEDIDYLKSYFNPKEKNFILKDINEIEIEEKILKLGCKLKEYRELNNNTSLKIKYNSIKNNELGKEIKSLTKEIKYYLFKDSDSILYASQHDINKDLKKINSYFDKLNENNNIEELIQKNNIVERKQNYIDSYIFNSIVNHSLYKYNKVYMYVKNKNQLDVITIEDLIQELAYLNNNHNTSESDKERRKKVLDNYFKGNSKSSKFYAKTQMEKALKNINYEMQKSADKFSELFNYDNSITK